jgi:hypothetical protein
VLGLPSRTVGKRCRGYILEMGAPILPELYVYLSDPVESVRAHLCDIIGELGDGDSVGRLQPLLQDPSTRVVDHANRAIERLRRSGAGPSQ